MCNNNVPGIENINKQRNYFLKEQNRNWVVEKCNNQNEIVTKQTQQKSELANISTKLMVNL